MSRDLTIKLETTSGNITMFYAFVDGVLKVADSGTATRNWSGKISEAQVRVKTRVLGIDDANYKLTIDLPGTAKDQSLELQLTGGYHEIEILL